MNIFQIAKSARRFVRAREAVMVMTFILSIDCASAQAPKAPSWLDYYYVAREYTDKLGRKQTLMFIGYGVNDTLVFTKPPANLSRFTISYGDLSPQDAAALRAIRNPGRSLPVNVYGMIYTNRNEGMTISPSKPPPGCIDLQLPGLMVAAIPTIAKAEDEMKRGRSAGAALSSFFVWWDDAKLVTIPKRGDQEAKAEWLISKLSIESRISNEWVAQWEDIEKELAALERNHLDNRFGFDLAVDYDYSPKNLARWVGKGLATLLCVGVFDGRRRTGNQFVAMPEATADGSATLITMGRKVQGRWVVMRNLDPDKDLKDRFWKMHYPWPKELMEFKPLNPEDLPEWWRRMEYRFIMDSREAHGLLIVTPFTRLAPAPKKRGFP